MRNETITAASAIGIDWKAIGYLTSIVSVFILGAIAWPKPDDPSWHVPALVIGMATSIIGMGFRYKAHLDERRELHRAKAEARRANGGRR
jgi:hypothetical protein